MGTIRKTKIQNKLQICSSIAEIFSQIVPGIKHGAISLLEEIEYEARKILFESGYADMDAAETALGGVGEDHPIENDQELAAIAAYRVIHSAREIRKLIATDDTEGVFLETVRMTTLSIQSKNLANTILGVKHRMQQQKSGDEGGKKISASRKRDHDEWREEAEKIRKKNPWLKNTEVAARVIENLGSSAKWWTVYKVILSK